MVRPTIATTTTAPVLLDIDTDFNQKRLLRPHQLRGVLPMPGMLQRGILPTGGGAVSAKDWYSVSGIDIAAR